MKSRTALATAWNLTVILAAVAVAYVTWVYRDSRLAISFVALLFGVLGLAVGIAVRTGHLRSRVLMFRRWDYPLIRNAYFALIPIGLTFILIAICGFAFEHQSEVWAVGVVLLTVPPMLASFGVGLWWMYSPPDLAKPDWLRAEEAEHGELRTDRITRRIERLWIVSIFAVPLIVGLLALFARWVGLI